MYPSLFVSSVNLGSCMELNRNEIRVWGDSIPFSLSSPYGVELHWFSLPRIERKARSVVNVFIGDGANASVQRLQRLTECFEFVALLSPSPPVFSGATDGFTLRWGLVSPRIRIILRTIGSTHILSVVGNG